MNNIISFPGLGLEFHISNVAFYLASQPIYWYGIIIALGFLLAAAYANKRAAQFGVRADDVLDMLMFVLPIGIICARLYYVAFSWDQYKDNPWEILATRHGGLAIYGGILGGIATILVFCKVKKINVSDMMDLMANSVIIGQIIGRWGNFVNGEAFGSQTTGPWRMVIGKGLEEATAIGNHPTFFYESAWNTIGFLLIHFYSTKRKYRGEILLLYMGWYGFGRFLIEGLRTDSLYIPGTAIRASQLVAAISCLIGVGGFLLNQRRPFLKAVSANDNKENTEEIT